MKNNIRENESLDETLDVPAEVDFRGGDRGKYAHRFGEVSHDEELVAEFLRNKGFAVEMIDRNRFANPSERTRYNEGIRGV